MDIDGYQDYLVEIGKWDSISGREIQKLAKLEHDLDIDIDDFIPYRTGLHDISGRRIR